MDYLANSILVLAFSAVFGVLGSLQLFTLNKLLEISKDVASLKAALLNSREEVD